MFRGEIIRTPLAPDSTSNGTVPCEFCDETFLSEIALMCHKKKHTDAVQLALDKGTVCLTCIKEYHSKEALDKHIRIEHFLSSETAIRIEREIFICNECEAIFFNKAMIACHISHAHNFSKIQTSECLHCKETVGKIKSFIKPQYRNHWNDRFSVDTCPICLKKCQNRKDYLTHIENTHGKKYYHCTICDYSTSYLIPFKNHCLEHEQSIIWPMQRSKRYLKRYKRCFVPTRQFRWKYFNWSYVPQNGLCIQRPYYICIMCREILSDDQEAMLSHLGSHGILKCEYRKRITSQVKKMFVCECSAKFDFEILLKQHQIKCKSSENVTKTNELSVQKQKKFPCGCGKNFEFPILLKRHQIECKTRNIEKFRCANQDSQVQQITKQNNASMDTIMMGAFKYNIIILPESDDSEAQIAEMAQKKPETPTFVFASSTQVLDTDRYEKESMQDNCEIQQDIVPYADDSKAQNIIIAKEKNILTNTYNSEEQNVKDINIPSNPDTYKYQDDRIEDIIKIEEDFLTNTYRSEDEIKQDIIKIPDSPDTYNYQDDNIEDIIKIEEDFLQL